MVISPWIWKSVTGFIAAPFAGHLTLVASAAIGSSIMNYYLNRRGKVLVIKIVNRVLWVLAGIVCLDAFFSAGHAIQVMFKF